MSHVAIIIGISGLERYLAREGAPKRETAEKKHARKFRSEGSAEAAARAHLATFEPFIRKAMSWRVEALELVDAEVV